MPRAVDVAIIGAGTAGLHALAEVRKATDNFVVIDGGTLGTVCARVGCMPSKVLIQIADDFHRRHVFAEEGIFGGDSLSVSARDALAHVRSLRDRFVSGVMDSNLEPLGDKLIRHHAEFIDAGLLRVGDQQIRASKIVIATGSTPTIPGPWRQFGERILTTDSVFEQSELPARMAVLGLGAVGLELGQALSRLGVKVDGFDAVELIGGLTDPEVNKRAVELLGREMGLHLGAAAEIDRRGPDLGVTANGETALVEALLVSVGRTPNLSGLHLERLGVTLDDNGIPPYDRETMQIAELPLFIAGDVDGDRAVLHEASHEGTVAGYNAVQDTPAAFRRRTPLAIAFTDPNICSVGMTWEDIDERTAMVGEACFDTGRAIVMRREGGVVRIYAEREGGAVLGAAMIAPEGEHLGHLLAWAVQRRLTVSDLMEMPFYHPVIEETLQSALADLAGRLAAGSDRPPGFAFA